MCGVCVCLTGLVVRARSMDTLGALERLAVQEPLERNTQLSSRRSESVTVNALKRFPHTHTHTHTHTGQSTREKLSHAQIWAHTYKKNSTGEKETHKLGQMWL